jgi:ADP-ribose pyrophosphatase YjhB (NUDIX family)
MNPFRFCPACASPIDEPGDSGVTCSNCGRIWYRNPAPTAGAAIVRDGRVLLTVRGRDPYAGKIDVPGGFLNSGETALEGLHREIDEELGVEIEASMSDCLQAEPHRYGDEGPWTVALGFHARLVSGEPTASDDVADLKWVEESELDELDFAWPHDRELARKALQREKGAVDGR